MGFWWPRPLPDRASVATLPPFSLLEVLTVKGEIMAFFPQWVGVARRGPQAASPAALAEHCFAPAVLKHVGPLTEVRAMSAA